MNSITNNSFSHVELFNEGVTSVSLEKAYANERAITVRPHADATDLCLFGAYLAGMLSPLHK